MRMAHIINGIVENIIEADSSFAVQEGFLVEDTGAESVGGWAEVGGKYENGTFSPYAPPEPTKDEQEQKRREAYVLESDPLFFGWQRSENTKQEWLDKVNEIRERYPYSEGN